MWSMTWRAIAVGPYLKVADQAALQAALHHGLERVAVHRRQPRGRRDAARHRVAPREVLVVHAHQVQGGHRDVARDAVVLRAEVGPVVALARAAQDDAPVEEGTGTRVYRCTVNKQSGNEWQGHEEDAASVDGYTVITQCGTKWPGKEKDAAGKMRRVCTDAL